MEKVKNFLNKYKAEILIVLGGLSSIIVGLQNLDGANAVIYSVTVILISALIEVLKHGISQASIDLIAKAVMIIITELQKKDEPVMASENAEKVEKLTIEKIKEMLQ